MKRAAIVISVLAVIAFVALISLGNPNLVGGSQPDETSEPTSPQVDQPIEDASPIKDNNQVVAEGRLIPINFVELSFNTSGLVEEVYISEGVFVSEGQLLARLSDREEYEANIAAAKQELAIAQQEIKNLYNSAPLAAAEALQDIVGAPEDVAAAQRTLDSLESGIVQDIDVDIARANVAFAGKKLKDAQDAYRPYANKAETNLTRAALLGKLAEAEQEYEDAVRKLNSLTGAPTQEKIDQAEADLILARVRFTEAQRRYEILKDGPDPDQLALVEARLDNAEANLAAAQAALLKLELRAPFAGTIANNDLKVGEFVALGVPVVMLVDFSDWLLETTDLTELNVVRISESSPAVITCDALPDTPFPGRVSNINAVGENRQGDITYRVVVEMDSRDDRLLWNMTCAVAILTE